MTRILGRLAAIGALCVALVAGCARESDGASLVKRGRLGELPRESVALVVIEVRSLGRAGRSTPWLKEIAAVAEEGPFKEIRERFGLDAFKDVERLGLAVVPQADNRVAYGILAEGAFDRAKMLEALGGQDLTTVQEGDAEHPDLSLALLGEGALAVGPRAVLEVVRANAAKRGSGLDANQGLLDLLARVRPASQIWGAVDCRRLTALARQFGAARGMDASPLDRAPQVSSLISLAFQGTVGKNVDFTVLAEADGEEGARNVADAVRGILAIARMGAGQDTARDWLEFFDGIRIEQTGTSIAMRGTIPEKTMAALIARARGGAGTAPGAS